MPLPPSAAFSAPVPAPNKWEKPELSGGQPILVDPSTKDKWLGLDDSYVVRAKILSKRPDGFVEFPLWLKTDVSDMPDFPVVESLTIEWGPGVNGQITVTMKMDFRMGRWFLDNEISRFGNTLVVQAGWPKADIWTPIFSGITEAPQPNFDPMGYDITLTAKILGMRLGRLRFDMGKYIKGKTSRREVVRAFLEEAGFTVQFYESAIAGKKEEDNEWLDGGVETGLVAGGRFWPEEHTIEAFIAWVCLEANMKCVMWPHPQTGEIYAFTFINRASVMSQEVKRELVMFSNINVEKGIYPLTGFSSDSPQVFWDRWQFGGTASDIDPMKKKDVNVEANEETSKMPSHGEETVGVRPTKLGVAALAPLSVIKGNLIRSQEPTDPELSELALEAIEEPGYEAVLTTKSGHPMMHDAPVDTAPGGVKIASPVGRDSSEEGRMQSYYDDKAMSGGIKATLKSIGMPDANPMMLVGVRGVGVRFDGVYKVIKVTHSLSAGTWDTDFDSVKSDFSKGSGLLETSRPLLPAEVVEQAYPQVEMPSSEAGPSGTEETPTEEAV